MPWMGPGKRYYYTVRRAGKRMVYDYHGAGDTATLIAYVEAIEQERRQEARASQRQERQQFLELLRTPPLVCEYSEAVAALVADVLRSLGFHQHRRQWRKRRMTTALESTAQRARDLFCQQKLTADDRRELRGILSEQATLARNLGDMARVAWRSYMTPLGQAAPGMQVAAEERATHLRRELGYAESSELEKLLIDDIVLCQFDYYRIERTYAIATAESYSLTVMQEWDAVLSSKQARLNRAILALARVRRLLKLPAVQINVNQAGGQQLNIAGG